MIRTANERTGRITLVNLGEGRCLRRRTASEGAKADNFTRQLRENPQFRVNMSRRLSEPGSGADRAGQKFCNLACLKR